METGGRQKKRISIFIGYFLGPLLFLWLSYSIYRQVRAQPDLEEKWEAIRASFGTSGIFILIGVIGLMVINWSIEAFKWKLSVQGIQRIKFSTAFRAILSGTS